MRSENSSVRPRFVPSTRFLLALLVCFGFIVQYAQRINLSIGIVCMVNRTKVNFGLKSNISLTENKILINQRQSFFFEERQFFWNEWEQQIILGSYWGGYLLTLTPSGWISITLGAKIMYAAAIFISSLATVALTSVYYFESSSFIIIVILRVLIGAAHGALFPVTYTLWAQWAVPEERGTLSAIGFCGTNIGTSFIVLIGGLLCRYVSSGWVHIFLVSGILGFIWLPLWMLNVSDTPAGHRTISNTERDYIQNIIGKIIQSNTRRPVSLSKLPWKKILQSKPVIGLFFSELCNLFGLFFFLTNLGKLLTEIHRIPSQYTGYVLACGFIFMLIGNLSSGIIADTLVRKDIVSVTTARKIFNSVTSFVPCVCMIILYFCDEKRQILGIIAVLLLLLSSGCAYGSGYVVNFSDIVPAYSGLIFGIATSFSSLSAVIGNIVAGKIIKHPTLEHWRKLFIMFFFSYFIAGAIFLLLGSAIPETWATFKSLEQEQNDAQLPEEITPMQEQIQSDKPTSINNDS